MSYAICRIKKLKAGSLNASAQHTQRTRPTPNADPEKVNISLIQEADTANTPPLDLETLVRQRIGEQKIRTNAVMAVEMLLSASPEYFRGDDKSEAGYYDPSRLREFQTTVQQWLVQKWGDRVVRAELHLDEATPHIHAYLVPLDDRGKLNCRGLFGDRAKLSQLQDSFAQAMSSLGLERGIKGSRASHTQIKQYYTAVTQAPDLSLDAESIQHQIADRGRILKENKEIKLTAKALSKQLERQDWQSVELEVKTDTLEQEVQFWKEKYLALSKLSDKTAQSLPLWAVAYELGLSPVDAKSGQWCNHEHKLKITDTEFSNLQSDRPNSKQAKQPTQSEQSEQSEQSNQSNQLKERSGSEIDLVMLVNNCNFNQAVAWINDRFGEIVAHKSLERFAKDVIKTTPVPKFSPPSSDESRWQSVRNYLTGELKISSQLVDKLHRMGLIYADSKQNLVSICRIPIDSTTTGAILKNTQTAGNKFTSLAPNSKRLEGWFYFESDSGSETNSRERSLNESITTNNQNQASFDNQNQRSLNESTANQNPAIERVVLVDSVVDALALSTLEQASVSKTMYLSLQENKQIPLEFLRSMPKQSVLIALNHNPESEKLAHLIRQKLPKQTVFKRPKSIDWHTELTKADCQKQQQSQPNPLSREYTPRISR